MQAHSQWMDLISKLRPEVAPLLQLWAEPLDQLASSVLTVLLALKHDFKAKWISAALDPYICNFPTVSATVPLCCCWQWCHIVRWEAPLGRCYWSLLKCQETVNAAAWHFGWREGDLVYALLSCWWPWRTPLAGPRGISHHWWGWVHKFWKFCWYSTDGQQIFYTSSWDTAAPLTAISALQPFHNKLDRKHFSQHSQKRGQPADHHVALQQEHAAMHQCSGTSKLCVKRAARPCSPEQCLLGLNLLSLWAETILPGEELKNERA